MRICYALLSPTFGMHQYTADLASSMVQAGHDVHLVTTKHLPQDRYAPDVAIHTPVATRNSGFSAEGSHFWKLGKIRRAVLNLHPDLVHISGPHLWNPLLLRTLRRVGVPTIHTIHDMHPHAGERYGRLLYGWNKWVTRGADHILVHGQRYRDELIAQGIAPSQVTYTPLTHLFVNHAQEQALIQHPPQVQYEPWALFMGRLLPYKGLEVLIEAARQNEHNGQEEIDLVIAGPGRLDKLDSKPIPDNIQMSNRLVGDKEAIDLFSRCGLLVLPYIEASQSALVAAAYFFHKPVIVTNAGALPEYVVEGKTGWVIPANDPRTLALALQKNLNNPEQLKQMGKAGRVWYERQSKLSRTILERKYAALAA